MSEDRDRMRREAMNAQNEQHAEQTARLMGESAFLGLALQDALSELVAVHGSGFLDVFLERRLRRNSLPAGALSGIPGALGQLAHMQDAAGQEAVRRAVEAVRLDPTRVS